MGSPSIFDLVETTSSPAKNLSPEEEFMELAKGYSKQNDPYLSHLSQLGEKAKNFGKNIGKSFLTGISRIGEIAAPLRENPFDIIQGKKKPSFEESLNALIPTEEGGAITNTISRVLKEAPSVAAFPGGIAALPWAAAGSIAGQAAEELGASPEVQLAAELTTMLGGPVGAKKLVESGKAKDILQAARKIGLTDAQVAPLLSSDGKKKLLTAISRKGARSQRALSSTRSALEDSYSSLKSSPEASVGLEKMSRDRVLREMYAKMYEMPSSVREAIASDLKQLLSGEQLTPSSLIKFWQDINHTVSSNPAKFGQLSQLKGPIQQGLASVSPEMANKFKITNNLYSKYKDISSRLKPKLTDQIIKASESMGTLYAIMSGNYPWLAKIAGEAAARSLATEMIVNPRFQQLGSKLVSALNQQKIPAAIKIVDQLAKEAHSISPEIASELHKIDWEEWKDLSQ